MKKQDRNRGEGSKSRGKAILQPAGGAVIGAAAAILLLIPCALLISAGVLKESFSGGCVLAACLVGGAVGGGYAVRTLGNRPLPAALGTSLLFFLLLAAAGALVCGGTELELYGLREGIASLGGGAIAGFLVKRPNKKRKR